MRGASHRAAIIASSTKNVCPMLRSGPFIVVIGVLTAIIRVAPLVC